MDRPRRSGPAASTAIPDAPLYDPRFEHDACGVGFVAETARDGRRSDRVVPLALDALAALTHRGAIAADARTGDGAGLAIPVVPEVATTLARDAGVVSADPSRLAIGTVFLPADGPAGDEGRRLVARALESEGLAALGWRPRAGGSVGPRAGGDGLGAGHPPGRRRPPAGMGAAPFERALLLARRTAEAARRRDGRPRGVPRRLADAADRGLQGALRRRRAGPLLRRPGRRRPARPVRGLPPALLDEHAPAWALAQPFRLVAHNGEINTLRGNREAMRGRAARLGGGRLGRRLGEFAAGGRPLLDPRGSDSASLDEALELLLAAGWRIDAAVMALMPEALELRDDAVPGLAAWQAAAVARVEPWDGPAALVFSDGRRVGCVLDRNGLRPAAFEVRRDGLVVCGSEAGMLPSAPGEIVRRGRLGPGELLLVDTVAAGSSRTGRRAGRDRRRPRGLATSPPGDRAGRPAGGADPPARPRLAPPSTPTPRAAPAPLRARCGQLRMIIRTMTTTGASPSGAWVTTPRWRSWPGGLAPSPATSARRSPR